MKKDKSAQGMSNVLIIETNLLVGSSDTWCIDSRTTSHICNMLQGFKETCRFKDGEIILKTGTNATVATVTIRTFILELSIDRILILEDCLFVPDIRRNLITISKLASFGYSFLFNESRVTIKFNNKFLVSENLIDGLYILSPIDNSINCVENDIVS